MKVEEVQANLERLAQVVKEQQEVIEVLISTNERHLAMIQILDARERPAA